VMEEMNLQLGGGKSNYINGAMKSKNTKTRYDCTLQSITYLYNNIESYKNPAKEYFDNIFSNNNAIDNRFLKFLFGGELLEKFDRDFDILGTAEKQKMFYINFAKELVFLQELKQTNGYVRKYVHETKLKGRRKNVLNEILWLLDMYCADQQEFSMYCEVLEGGIEGYKAMMKELVDDEAFGKYEVEEEVIK